jgi:hypothetical protein
MLNFMQSISFLLKQISPLGAFYLAHFIDEADEEEASRTAGEEERNLVRRSNGEKLVSAWVV